VPVYIAQGSLSEASGHDYTARVVMVLYLFQHKYSGVGIILNSAGMNIPLKL
jgi:hypothetical protein